MDEWEGHCWEISGREDMIQTEAVLEAVADNLDVDSDARCIDM
jgi:hypothetical protein